MTMYNQNEEVTTSNQQKTRNSVEGITPQVAIDSLRQIILKQDEEALHGWIELFLKTRIPRKAITEGNNAPFDFVRDYIFDRFSLALVLGNRASGKTLDFGVLQAIDGFFNGQTEIANLGAIQEQANKNYKYLREFNSRPPFISNIERTSMRQTIYKNGSEHQILVATMSGVNSPHPQRGFIDEIDLIPWGILQQAFSMTQSKNGVTEKLVLTSTRKFAAGAMQRLIDERKKRGLSFYQWNIWDVVEKLPVDDSELMEEIQNTFGDELPENIAQADGFYKWRDLINKRRLLDDDTWQTEWICSRPGLEGVIYGTSFSDENNVIANYNPKDEGGTFFIFEDFGFGQDHPNVVLFVHVPNSRDRVIIFDELYLTGSISEDVWEQVEERLAEYGLTVKDLSGWIHDPAGQTEAEERRRRGAPILKKVEDKDAYKIKNGIAVVKKFWSSGRCMITAKCVQLRTEVLSYKKKQQLDGTYTDIPEKKLDHGPDALRYGLIKLNKILKLFGIAVIIEDSTEDEPKQAKYKPVTKPLVKDENPITAGLLGSKF